MNSRSQTLKGLILRRAPEAHVFSRACRGDAVAFAEVYRRYKGPLYAFCLARLLSRDAAEDATQETFTRVLSTPEPVRNPQAWLFSVARNVCIDVGRRRAREAVVESPPDELRSAPAVADAAEEAMAAWRARLVLLALRRMRPRYRTALILKEVHGLPASDIADSLGISEGATHTLLSRARRSFGRAYAEVSGLSQSCSDAVVLMFKSSTSTLQKSERSRLDAHLSTCERCRAEDIRLTTSTFSGLLPILVAQSGAASGLIAQALLAPKPPLSHAVPSVQTAVQVGVPVVVACALLATELAGIVPPPLSVDGLPAAGPGVALAETRRLDVTPEPLDRVLRVSIDSRTPASGESPQMAEDARIPIPAAPASVARPGAAAGRGGSAGRGRTGGPRRGVAKAKGASGGEVRARVSSGFAAARSRAARASAKSARGHGRYKIRRWRRTIRKD